MRVGGGFLGLPTQTFHSRGLDKAYEGLWRKWIRRVNCWGLEQGTKGVKSWKSSPIYRQKSKPSARVLIECLCAGLCQARQRKSLLVRAGGSEVNRTICNGHKLGVSVLLWDLRIQTRRKRTKVPAVSVHLEDNLKNYVVSPARARIDRNGSTHTTK